MNTPTQKEIKTHSPKGFFISKPYTLPSSHYLSEAREVFILQCNYNPLEKISFYTFEDKPNGFTSANGVAIFRVKPKQNTSKLN